MTVGVKEKECETKREKMEKDRKKKEKMER